MEKIKSDIYKITSSLCFSEILYSKYAFFRQRSYLPFLVFLRFVYLGALRTSVINRMHTSHFNFNFELSVLNYFYKIASHLKTPETSYLSFRVKREIFNQALRRVQVCSLKPIFLNSRSGRQFHENQNVRFQTSNQYKTINLKQHKESPSVFNSQAYFLNRNLYKNFQVQVTNLNPHGVPFDPRVTTPHPEKSKFLLQGGVMVRQAHYDIRQVHHGIPYAHRDIQQAYHDVRQTHRDIYHPEPVEGWKSQLITFQRGIESNFSQQFQFCRLTPLRLIPRLSQHFDDGKNIRLQVITPYRITNLHMAENLTVRGDSVTNTNERNYFMERMLHFNDRYVQRHELRELEKTLDKTRESVRESAKNNSSTFDNIARILKQIPDMDSLSDRVYRDMERRIRMERERRGM